MIKMNKKNLPFNKREMEEIISEYPTPFYIYDEQAIRDNAKALKEAFSWQPKEFINYFAVKALPNPYIMKILAEEGMGADCSSLAELILAEKVGITGEKIMFTSNDTPLSEYEKALELGAIINLDDITHIDYLAQLEMPELICCRYNPGPLKEGNTIIGKPEEAKYGFTREQLFQGYKKLKEMGVTRFGLHTMVASNELDPKYFIETAQILLELVAELTEELGISFEFVNLGGGIGIPYKPEETAVDMKQVSEGIKKLFKQYVITNALKPLRIVMESGRMVTGPYGYLVSKAIHRKDTYKNYIGLDSCMADLMRPGLYGSYHHISVLGKEDADKNKVYDVTGSLCENNDKFAIDRKLPEIDLGDIVVIHDSGAHGRAMGFNYNGKLRPAELLMKSDGSVEQIRRAETLDDYFATLDFSRLD